MDLVLPDPESLADVRTFVGRATALDSAGAVRLQATGDVLALTVGVLPGSGLLHAGLTLGMRVVRLGAPAELDTTVSFAALADRFPRLGSTATALPVPPTEVFPEWRAQTPPRGPWEPLGAVAVTRLRRAAQTGMDEITRSASGGTVTEARRREVWAARVEQAPDLPSGAAFAAHGLGFLVGDQLEVYRSGSWRRLSSPVGHVLVR
ncbi:hypothetical protein [Arsenicicoccus piscis]|uniref:Uncharacterized protein n=1 Tax=Arsenicicoccus piscis TaxID=673954 RepID=A0ABQ6HKH9_9MICO|nr:hypothetical protein [Arsenicicoccus piscis]GMA18667.1 hypothetical protein GCM10025862_06880 [Arsenicicoccus piscis]